MISEFVIIDHTLLNKKYYYIKPYSNILIRFSCDFIRKENYYDIVQFRVNINLTYFLQISYRYIFTLFPPIINKGLSPTYFTPF